MFVATDTETELQLIARMRREIEAFEAEWLEHVSKYDRNGTWLEDGDAGRAAAAIAEACNMYAGTTTGHVKLAHKLRKLPEVRDAFAAGDISRAHVNVIASRHTADRAPLFSQLESEFVDLAKTFDPKIVAEAVSRYTDAHDGDDGAGRDKKVHDRRRLHLSPSLDGAVLSNGVHDPLSGEIWMTAIDAEMERDRLPNETRTPAQRRHDAATNIMRRALENGELGTSRGVRPHVSLVQDVKDLETKAPRLVAEARSEVEHVGRLSRAMVERLLCDCTISRVIVNGSSQVLDVGRATRNVSVAQWRALVARDDHCTHPGCDKKPAWCEAHHIIFWEDGGATDIDNLRLVCWYHHTLIHHARAGP